MTHEQTLLDVLQSPVIIGVAVHLSGSTVHWNDIHLCIVRVLVEVNVPVTFQAVPQRTRPVPVPLTFTFTVYVEGNAKLAVTV